MHRRLERKEDLEREDKAISTFVSTFGGTYKKLGENDVDFRVHNSEGELIAYVEVKGRNRTIDNAFPLPISAAKLVKLCKKNLNPVIIWACTDGIIYAKVKNIVGSVTWGGRTDRGRGWKDRGLMVTYNLCPALKIIRY